MTAPSGAKMHADEVEIDATLVRRLLGEQFPDWVEALVWPRCSKPSAIP
jgi:hypothetical protein